MAGIELAKAYVTVGAVAGQGFAQDMDRVKGEARGHMLSLGRMMGPIAGFFAASKVLAFGESAVQSFSEAEEASARLSGVLKATAGAAGYSQEQLEGMASSLQATTVYSDEAIMAGQAKLLTYKSVAGDVFNRAMKAATDLSAVGFGSVESASNMLGKALENPAKGLTALTRVGVTFSNAQRDQILKLTKSGELMKAQGIIMAAVEGQVGGTAEAIAATDTGQLKVMANQMDDLKEKIGKAFLPFAVTMAKVKLWAMEAFTKIVAWASVMYQNMDKVWEIMKLSAAIQISRIMGYFVNLWQSLPMYASAAFQTTITGFKAWWEGMKSMLNSLWEMFKLTFESIKGLWDALWTDKTIMDVMRNHMTEMSKIMLDHAVVVGQGINDTMATWQQETAGIDLGKNNAWFQSADEMSNKMAGITSKLAEEAMKAMEQKSPEVGKALGTQIADAASDASIKSGMYGLADLGKKIQESLYGGKDAQMISLMEKGNQTQEDILKATKEINLGLT